MPLEVKREGPVAEKSGAGPFAVGEDGGMDQERRDRIRELADAIRTSSREAPEPEEVQRILHERGVHGPDAVIVTMRVLDVEYGEAARMFFNSPLRTAERDFHNAAIDALDRFFGLEERQSDLCDEQGVPWTQPGATAVVTVARGLASGAWPISGLRRAVDGTDSGWRLWIGEGGPDTNPDPDLDPDPDRFEVVGYASLYDRCPEAVPYLGLPPGWRFLAEPDHAHVWNDPELLTG